MDTNVINSEFEKWMNSESFCCSLCQKDAKRIWEAAYKQGIINSLEWLESVYNENLSCTISKICLSVSN